MNVPPSKNPAVRMRTFTEADGEYRRAIEAPGRELSAAFSAARQVAKVDLQSDDISRAILLRLKSFLEAQDIIKLQLQKVYAAPAADFFVEAVVFYLQVAFAQLAPDLRVSSEENIVAKQGSLRPDISIWRQDQVIAAIECKTQLGWNRNGWLPDFEDRELRLTTEFPNAKLFLLVVTGRNWPGFGNNLRVGKQFFVLLNDIWPRDYIETSSNQIKDRVEVLISILLSLAA
jgi:hypothetical protein